MQKFLFGWAVMAMLACGQGPGDSGQTATSRSALTAPHRSDEVKSSDEADGLQEQSSLGAGADAGGHGLEKCRLRVQQCRQHLSMDAGPPEHACDNMSRACAHMEAAQAPGPRRVAAGDQERTDPPRAERATPNPKADQ